VVEKGWPWEGKRPGIGNSTYRTCDCKTDTNRSGQCSKEHEAAFLGAAASYWMGVVSYLTEIASFRMEIASYLAEVASYRANSA